MKKIKREIYIENYDPETPDVLKMISGQELYDLAKEKLSPIYDDIENLVVSIDDEAYYDYTEYILVARFTSPETEAEAKARKKAAEKNKAKKLKDKEARKKQWEKLNKEFGVYKQ